MKPLGHIRVLSDGRPGHENQSTGLALALARRTGATHEVVRIDPLAPVWRRMCAALQPGERAGEPDLVIAAGHRMHLPLWWAGRRFGARTVVIMSPSVPRVFFDLSLVPQHDAPNARETPARVLTRGALNRVPETRVEKTATGLVLIGGPSKHHGWDGGGLAAMIKRVIAAQPGLEWTVADSRRTPAGYLEQLEVAARKVPEQTTGRGWLAGELATTRVVWVTADSVSMVHEAATAGAATGVFPVPLGADGGGRPQRSVEHLIAEGFATDYAAWERAGAPVLNREPAKVFHETGRCADLIVERWFAEGVKTG